LDGKEIGHQINVLEIDINDDEKCMNEGSAAESNDRLFNKAMQKVTTMKKGTGPAIDLKWNNDLKGQIE